MAPSSSNHQNRSASPLSGGKLRLAIALWLYAVLAVIGGLQKTSQNAELFENITPAASQRS